MRKLFIILFTLLSFTGFSQYITTPAVVADTTALKAYKGPSGLIQVTDSAYMGLYHLCPSCTVDHSRVFQGVASRKWRRSVPPETYEQSTQAWGTFTGDIADQTDLADSLENRLPTVNPISTGNFKHGSGISGTIPDGAGTTFTPQLLVSEIDSTVALGVHSNIYNNRRFGLFVDQKSGQNVVGLSQTSSSSPVPLVYRTSTGEWWRIHATGQWRLPYYNTTAGYLTNETDGDIVSVTSIPKADVGLSNVDNTSDANKPVSTAQATAIGLKQDVLVSGTNIKTINGNTILGSGDIPISIPTRVFLGSDVANSTTSFASVTGLQFPVVGGGKYEFRFFIVYNSASTSTGAAFSINGPTLTATNYVSTTTLSTTSRFSNVRAGYNLGTETSNSISTNNIAIIEGVIECSASGNVVATFKSGVAASAITVKAGNTYVSYTRID